LYDRFILSAILPMGLCLRFHNIVGKDPIILHVFVTKDCVYSMDDEHYSYVHPRLFLRTFVLCKSVPG